MDPPTPRPLDRRTYLAGLAGLASPALSGCSGDEPSAEPTDGTTPPASGTAQPTATPADTPSSSTTLDESTPARSTPSTTAVFPGYRTTEVTARTPDGTTLCSVTAAIADTASVRYTGLSDTPSLPDDWGMLFVFESAGPHPFVMRGMEYGLDIVFVDADRTISRIHHAPAPGPGEDGDDQRYPGSGKYVLEVNLDWTTDHGVSEGDVLEFEL